MSNSDKDTDKQIKTTTWLVTDGATDIPKSATPAAIFEDCRPPKPFHAIAHHIVELFKDRFSGTTDAGFRCHCGHKGGVQFTDYQAMTSPVAWAIPSVVCDRVIAAWRAHTKDLGGVHPNAEDQIRDFFSRQLEQPGGPTVTTPRYPLTTIPPGTPKPKSIAISAFVNEELRRIIVDHAEKLRIEVEPVSGSEWLVSETPSPGFKEKTATATAMREYLARLLYGDEGTAEETPPLELANTSPSDGRVDFANEIGRLAVEAAAQGKSTFRANVTLADPLNFSVFNIRLAEKTPAATTEEQTVNNDRPTRIILRSYAADDKPRIERLLGLARQLQLPVQLAGPWSCTAFPNGEEAHPALDVVFPEVLVHPRDVLILTFPNGEHIGDHGGTNLSEIENQLLWETREQDQRFITGLIELLGLHAEASRGDIAAAVEAKKGLSQPAASHPGAMECETRTRELIAWRTSVLTALDLPPETSINQVIEAIEDQAKQVSGWRSSYTGVSNQLAAERMATAENQRKLLDILRAGTVEPSWERCISYAEARVNNASQFEDEVAEALGLPTDSAKSHVVKWAKSLVGRNKYQTEKLAEALGYKSDDYCELLQQVQQLVKVKQEIVMNLTLRQELEASEDKAEQFEKTVAEAMGLHPTTSTSSTIQRAKWLKEQNEYQTTKLSETLGFQSTDRQWNDFPTLLEHTKRLVAEHQTLLGERIDSNAKIKRLEEFVDKVGPERDGLKDRVGGLVVELTNARAEIDKLRAYQLSRLESDSYLERVKKERDNVVDQLNAIHVRMLNILGSTPGIAWPSIFTSVEKAVKERDNLGEKLDSVHRDLAKRLGLPSDAGWVGIFTSVEKAVKERDNLGEKLDSVHRDLAKRLGLPSDAGWVGIMSAVERIVEDSQDHAEVRANNKGLGVKLATVEKERDALKEQLETAKGLPLQIADALDAPPGERSFLTDDGSLNTALVDRIIGYFKQLYTAAGYSEPPQGGWGEILTHIRKYTGFKPENPVEWPKYLKQNADNSKE